MQSFYGIISGFRLVLAFILIHSFILGAQAQLGDEYAVIPVPQTSHMLYDPVKDRIYVSQTTLNQISVIDVPSKNLIGTYPVQPAPTGLALSADGNTLYIASRDVPVIEVFDVGLMQPVNQLFLPEPTYDLVVKDSQLFASPAVWTNGGIVVFDLLSQTVVTQFDPGFPVYQNSLLRLGPDKRTLYYADTGVSPGRIASFNLDSGIPFLIQASGSGALGSNGQDLELTADGQFVSYATGSGNTSYDVARLNVFDFSPVGFYNTGPYPRQIAYSPDGLLTFIHHQNGGIAVFETDNFIRINDIITPPQPVKELLFEKTGSHLYAAFDDDIRVYSAINTTVPITAVSLNDPALQQCLNEQIQLYNWQFVEDVTEFTCSGRGVNYVNGMEQFPRLSKLDLSDNNIVSFMTGAAPMASLVELDLSNNQLLNIGPADGMERLAKINLSYNPLSQTDLQFELQQLTGLTHLNLANTPIMDIGFIPTFDPLNGGPSKLIELDISGSKVQYINGIEAFENLRNLNISNTAIYDLFPLISTTGRYEQLGLANLNSPDPSVLSQIISNNPGLTQLDASGWKIGSLGQLPWVNPQTGQAMNIQSLRVANAGLYDIFGIELLSQSLTELDISGNDVEFIGPLSVFQSLAKLNLSGNSRIQVAEVTNVLTNLQQLTELGLSGIRINSFQDLSLTNQQTGQPFSLSKLDLSNTGIIDVVGIELFLTLEALDLSDTQIHAVQSLQGLTNLRELNLSNTEIFSQFEVDIAIGNKPDLVKLGLAGIPLSPILSLPLVNPVPGLPYQLKRLDISNTGVTEIFQLQEFPYLEELDISNNNIVNLNALFGSVNLRRLNLSGNHQISGFDISGALNNSFKLTHLNLSGISIFDLGMLGLPYEAQQNLLELNVSNTGLRELFTIEQYQNLKTLDLSGNLIEIIQPISQLQQLESLDISNNLIADLLALSSFYELRKLDVGNNPALLDPVSVFNIIGQNQFLEAIGLAGIPLQSFALLPIQNGPLGQPYNIKQLDLSRTRIVDLFGIEQYPSIASLNLSGNPELVELGPLQALGNLAELDISDTGAFNLIALSQHTKLASLNVSNLANVSPADLTPILNNNKGLIELQVAGIPLIDMFNLAIPTEQALRMKVLNLSNTGLNSIGSLYGYPNLEVLNVSNNNLASLDGLQALHRLRDLDIAVTNSSTLVPFIFTSRLQRLNISGNPNDFDVLINDWSQILQSNPGIRSLGLANLGIVDLYQMNWPAPVPGTFGPAWTELDISGNPLNNIGRLSDLPGLKRLYMRDLIVDQNQPGPFLPISLNPLTYFQSPKVIDLRGNDHFVCGDIDQVEISYVPGVVIRPATCLQSLPPELYILEPAGPVSIEEGMSVTLVADAFDPEDGVLVNQVQWTSSLDGLIGTGGTVTATLSVGTHIITASVQDSHGGSASKTVSVTVTPAIVLSYCSSKGNSSWYEWINAVDFNGMQVTSGDNNGYVDNTATEFVAQRGGSYPMTLIPGFRYGAYTENYKVWIDFNRDGSFTADEEVLSGSSNTNLTQSVTVPVVAIPGKTRMRVAMRWGGAPPSCGSYSWGETEDFTLNIQ